MTEKTLNVYHMVVTTWQVICLFQSLSEQISQRQGLSTGNSKARGRFLIQATCVKYCYSWIAKMRTQCVWYHLPSYQSWLNSMYLFYYKVKSQGFPFVIRDNAIQRQVSTEIVQRKRLGTSQQVNSHSSVTFCTQYDWHCLFLW